MKRSIVATEEQKLKTLKTLKAQCERDREIVKGIFKFYECEGGTLAFSFRAYKWDEVEKYSLTDGEICSIPLGVAKHLNKNGWYPEYSFIVDEMGRPTMSVSGKKRRFGFQSMEFMELEEIGQANSLEIVTAQPI